MKNKKGKQYLLFALFTVCGGIFGYLIGSWIKSSDFFDLVNGWVILLILPVIYLMVIAWHELGHAIAGIWVGLDWKMYVVGPFMWEKKENRWSFSWNKNTNVSGGLVVCLPTTEDRIADRFQWFSLGGPLSSLLGSLLFFLFALILPPTTKVVFWIFGAFHFFIFLATAIPFRSGGFFSDGMRFLRLRKGNPIRQLEAEFLRLITLTQHGVRPKNWPTQSLISMIELAKRLSDPYLVYLYSYRYQHALDNEDWESAQYDLEQYIELRDQLPASFQSMVWLDAAYFQAFALKNAEKAESFFVQFKEIPMIPKSYIWSTQAEIAWAKGNFSEFDHFKSMALEKMNQMMDKSLASALTYRLTQPRV